MSGLLTVSDVRDVSKCVDVNTSIKHQHCTEIFPTNLRGDTYFREANVYSKTRGVTNYHVL